MHPEIIELKPKQRSLEISEKQSNTSCNNNRVGRYYFYEIMLHFFNKYKNSEVVLGKFVYYNYKSTRL
jgi:hypothetical protein